jgi:hypothetical protein
MLCAWGYRPVIQTLVRLNQEDLEFKVSLSYIVRHWLRRTRTTTKKIYIQKWEENR